VANPLSGTASVRGRDVLPSAPFPPRSKFTLVQHAGGLLIEVCVGESLRDDEAPSWASRSARSCSIQVPDQETRAITSAVGRYRMKKLSLSI
jgi:hypothetical protein